MKQAIRKKEKTKCLIVFMLLCCFFNCSKDSEKTGLDFSVLIDQTLKLAGMVENGKEIVIPDYELNKDELYWLVFKEDNTFSGVSSVNSISGVYELNTTAEKITITSFFTTEVMESTFGKKYVKALQNVTSYYISDKEINLFYGKKSYMKFIVL